MNTTSQNDAGSEATRIWEYVEHVINNPQLLSDYGFPNRDSVRHVVVILLAGDSLHPDKGLHYLGPDWEKLSDSKRHRLISQRDNAIEKIMRKAITTLQEHGFETAFLCAAKSKHQVVYLSRTKQETRDNIQSITDSGVHIWEFGDYLIERAEHNLVLVFNENYSNYVPDKENF